MTNVTQTPPTPKKPENVLPVLKETDQTPPTTRNVRNAWTLTVLIVPPPLINVLNVKTDSWLKTINVLLAQPDVKPVLAKPPVLNALQDQLS